MPTLRFPILRLPAPPSSFLALSSTARSLLLSMLADDPAARPSAAAVLRHPFITAVDSNAEAQREMGDVVRRRMVELAQLRCGHIVHGARCTLPTDIRHGRLLPVNPEQYASLLPSLPSTTTTRRVHGLRYALHVGQALWGGKAADKVALLEELDRRRRLLRGCVQGDR